MSQETFPVANVGGKEIPYDPDQLRRIQEHPCFAKKLAMPWQNASGCGPKMQHTVQVLREGL